MSGRDPRYECVEDMVSELMGLLYLIAMLHSKEDLTMVSSTQLYLYSTSLYVLGLVFLLDGGI